MYKHTIFNNVIKNAKPAEAGSLNNNSCLARALGVTKFITIIAMFLATLCCAT